MALAYLKYYFPERNTPTIVSYISAYNYARMIAEANSRHIDVVMLGVPTINLLTLNSADFYQAIAESQQIPVDLNTLPDILGDNSLKSYMIHPNDEG